MVPLLTIPPRDLTRPHIVDQLIDERAVRLRSHPKLWAVMRALINPVLGYQHAIRMADQVAPMDGRMTLNWMSATLRLQVEMQGEVPELPKTGPLVIVANHPGGIADGIAVWDALVEQRPDMIFFANRDALRVAPKLEEVIVPVEWRQDARSHTRNRETLRAAARAFQDGRAVVIFPSGRIAQWRWRQMRLVEEPWASTPVAMARKFGAPILPVGVNTRMSLTYYALAQISEELKNITLFHELLRARGWRYRLRFGQLTQPDDLPPESGEATDRLRMMTEALAARI